MGLKGIVVAGMTPLTERGAVRLELIPDLLEHYRHEGVTAVYALGSTGEGPSLTGSERRAVAEAWVEASAGRLPVLVQVGHNSLAEARELAAHAQGIGADAISMHLPGYFKPSSAEAAAACLAEVGAGAPDLPLLYYHIPALTGVELDLIDLLDAARDRAPTLAGVKFTDPRLHELQAAAAHYGEALDLLFGCDEMLLEGLVAGAAGAVGSTYNFGMPIYRRVLDAYGGGDLEQARLWQGRAVEMIRVILRHGGNAAIKATMRLAGHDCGPTRLPQVALGGAAEASLRTALDRIGFFGWIDG